VFEYLRFPAWVLALEEPSSATARVLEGRADVVEPSNEEAIAGIIRRRYLEHESGVHPHPIRSSDLSRRTQAQRFGRALDELDSNRTVSQ